MKQLYGFLLMVFVLASSTVFGQSAQDARALNHLKELALSNGYSTTDFQNPLISDSYSSKGIDHVYLTQTHNGIEILDATAGVHMANGQVVAGNINFMHSVDKMKKSSSTPAITAMEAIQKLSTQKNYDLDAASIQSIEIDRKSKNQAQKFTGGNISNADISARLVYVAIDKNAIQLAWSLAIDEKQGTDYMNYFVDATSGKIAKEISWTVHCSHGEGHAHTEACTHDHDHGHDTPKTVVGENSVLVPNSYNVFPWPIESPNFGGRSLVTDPQNDNVGASPNGWHNFGGTNFTTTRGNNADAYLDNDDTNSPTGGDAARVDGGANLEFDFPWTAAGAPTTYQDAALTNLFYWSNVTHDVWYNYGFDEQSGNFQEENYGNGGNGSDYVYSEAQDGSGSCNANFGTPPDGSNPRMQMYLCNARDGDFDNGVVVHEIGHGISNRLTGGPAAAGCLGNQEQMGEGWSDFFGTIMTIQPGDVGTDARPMGTWLFEQGPNGGGIRPYPYSTDLGVNPMTYNTIGSGVSVPHGVGSVWCTMLWEMTWALIDEYGWDADIYNGTGGNNIAMRLVIEGLKLQPCSPGFVDGRDAILAADQAVYGGANQCLIWEAFAKRGLGFSASQGSSGSVSDGSEAFDMPPSCSIGLEKTASVATVGAGGNITYTITASNNTGATLNNVVISDDLPANTFFVSAANGGTLSGNTVSFPATSLGVGASTTVSFTVQVDPSLNGNVPDFLDDMESGSANWTTNNSGSSSFAIQSATANSGSSAWFAADVASNSTANLIVASPLGLTSGSTLTFIHNYNTEATWDGGTVAISTDNGSSWMDLGSAMTSGGYNSTINNSAASPAFSGNSNGFVTTVVNLSAYAGQNALIRFTMNCDQSVGGTGWYVDDVSIKDLGLFIPNTASVTDGSITSTGSLANPTEVTGTASNVVVTATGSDVSCNGASDGSATATATGGATGNYTYAWSNGATGASVTGLSAGTYTVTATDGADSGVGSVTIGTPTNVSVTTTVTNANGGNNGSATAAASGGTAPYTYAWTPGGAGATITGLAPGTYTVVATDANGCTATTTAVVGDDTPSGYCTSTGTNVNFEWIQTVAMGSINNDSGANGGYGDFTAQSTDIELGASVPFTFTPGFAGTVYNETWVIFIDYNKDLDFDDAGETVYTSANVSTAVSDAFTVPAGVDLGSTRMRISMKWNATPTACETFQYGEVEDYTVNIVEASGNDPLVATASSTDETCLGDNDGSATVTATAGTGTYTYAWSNGGSTATITGLGAGTYTCVVSDGNESVTVTATVAAGESNTYYADTDNDGYGDANNTIIAGCTAPAGYVSNIDDCNDNNAAINPGATEVCDGVDNNCDGNVDEGLGNTYYADADGDSYGDAGNSVTACTAPAGYVTNANDCNDNNAAINPGAMEVCDGVDNNCDGNVDEGLGNTYYADADGDSYGDAGDSVTACIAPAGYVLNADDCNDNNAAINPGATEVCDGVDNNCDGNVDEGLGNTYYADADGDSYGDAGNSITACTAPAGYVSNADDCNDGNAAINPDATEVCDGVDNNCDGNVDEGLGNTYYADVDGDGFGDANNTTIACSVPNGYTTDNTDCDDNDANNYIGATCDDGNSNTADDTIDANCNCVGTPVVGCSDNPVTLSITLDNYPQETSWNLADANGNVVESGGTYGNIADGTTITFNFCLPDGCYDFTINDSYGDGICCAYGAGSYALTNDATGATLAAGGAFESTETTNFCLGGLPPVTYCGSTGNNQNYEWIESVTLGSIDNTSGSDGGYGDYTGLTTSASAGDVVALSLTPGFANTTYTEQWSVWVDFDRDGDFTGTGEQVYQGSGQGTVNGSFTIPSNAVNGDLRVRVSMKWGSSATPCESFTYGEVEDYTLLVGASNFGGGVANREITSKTGAPEVFTTTQRAVEMSVAVYPNPVQSELTISYDIPNENKAQMTITDFTGKVIQEFGSVTGTNSSTFNVSDLPAGYYLVRLSDGTTQQIERFVVIK